MLIGVEGVEYFIRDGLCFVKEYLVWTMKQGENGDNVMKQLKRHGTLNEADKTFIFANVRALFPRVPMFKALLGQNQNWDNGNARDSEQ